MRIPGQRGGKVDLILAAQDVIALSDALVEAIPEAIYWPNLNMNGLADHGGQPPVARSLAAADLGGQVFIRLADEADRLGVGPLVQFSPSLHPARLGIMEPGGLAFRWVPEETAPELHDRFGALAKNAFAAARLVTRPQKLLWGSSPVSNIRIGPEARRLVESGAFRLQRQSRDMTLQASV